MSIWPDVVLGDLLKDGAVSYGVVQPGNDVSGGVPIVRVKDIRNGVIETSAPIKIDRAISQKHSKTLLSGGELLMTLVGTVGEVAIAPPPMAGWNVARAIAVIRSEIVSSRWLQLSIESPTCRAQINALLNTTVQATLNLSDLKTLKISMPPSAERQAIMEVLGALDDKIAANIQLAKTSGQLALALLGAARANDVVYPLISDVVKVLVRGVTPSYTESQEHSIIVLNQKCVRGQRVAMGPSRRTARNKVRSEKILIPGDVLVNSTGQGTLGRVARWTGAVETTVDSHLTIVRFDESQVDLTCAGYAMLELQPEIEELGEGSTGQTELSRVELGRLKLSLPPLDKARRLGEDLAKMAELEDSLLGENSTLAELRDTLLPELMSGRLRVKDAEKKIEEVV